MTDRYGLPPRRCPPDPRPRLGHMGEFLLGCVSALILVVVVMVT
jgi:hypothetical protein